MSRTAPFWMVCRTPMHPQAKTEPRQRYENLADARVAAQKMANQTGKPFTILSAVESVQPKDANQKDLF